jgi:1,4-dihydroxy-2-naphthoyl-CoA hydrolase
VTLQDDEQAVGLEINANHLRAARSGWVTGLCRPVHIGRASAGLGATEVFDEQQRLCCTSRMTVSILRR